MMPDLHKFTGYVQPLTAKTWPGLPIYFNYLNNDFIDINLYKKISNVILNKAK